MAASQLQLLARNLKMRGQGQQRASGDLFVLVFLSLTSLYAPLAACLPHFHPTSTSRYVRLILHFTYASLSRPPPPPASKTNLIPSWPRRGTEAMRLVRKGRRRAERGQERVLVAPPRRPAGGERGHSQVPSLEHSLHVSAVSPHHTHTHTCGRSRHAFKATGD